MADTARIHYVRHESPADGCDNNNGLIWVGSNFYAGYLEATYSRDWLMFREIERRLNNG